MRPKWPIFIYLPPPSNLPVINWNGYHKEHST